MLTYAYDELDPVTSLEVCLFFSHRVIELKVLPLLNGSSLPGAENGVVPKVPYMPNKLHDNTIQQHGGADLGTTSV